MITLTRDNHIDWGKTMFFEELFRVHNRFALMLAVETRNEKKVLGIIRSECPSCLSPRGAH